MSIPRDQALEGGFPRKRRRKPQLLGNERGPHKPGCLIALRMRLRALVQRDGDGACDDEKELG